jgi:hypothetical protein
MGKLVAGIVRDPSLIHKTLGSFIKHDDFIARLLEVSSTFHGCDATVPRQDVHMCILRTDYMIDVPTNKLKLVEYNTIASGAGCLSQIAADV